jgi:hypothetical protein
MAFGHERDGLRPQRRHWLIGVALSAIGLGLAYRMVRRRARVRVPVPAAPQPPVPGGGTPDQTAR